MPVRKFRSADEMPPAAICAPLDPANVALACRLSDLAARLRPRRFPEGVHRYRSVEAASLARAAWERATTADESSRHPAAAPASRDRARGPAQACR